MVSQHNALISIIMPAHNAALYIEEAVQSVLEQSYPHWELLIIDDASQDATGELATRFADPRIVYTRVERIGSPSGVRNVGLKMAQGEFIAFLDADDRYFPDTLERLITCLQQNEGLTAVYGFAATMDEHGTPMPDRDVLIRQSSGAFVLPSGYQHTWERIVTGRFSCLLPSLMLRRSSLERVGLFNEALCGPEDYEFFVRLFLDNLDGVAFIPQYMYHYRIHSASLTKSPEHSQKILSSVLTILEWLFVQPQLPDQIQALKSLAYTHCYRYQARERLLNGQPAITRYLVGLAWKNPNVSRVDWLKECLPLFIRACLPLSLNHAFVMMRRDFRALTLRTSLAKPARQHV